MEASKWLLVQQSRTLKRLIIIMPIEVVRTPPEMEVLGFELQIHERAYSFCGIQQLQYKVKLHDRRLASMAFVDDKC